MSCKLLPVANEIASCWHSHRRACCHGVAPNTVTEGMACRAEVAVGPINAIASDPDDEERDT
jgi:hypothetical protein